MPSDSSPSVIHLLWSGQTGGAERSVYQLARYQLKYSDLQVCIGFGRAKGEFACRARDDGVTVMDFNMTSGHDLRALARIMSILRRFDVHHFHSPEPILMLASLMCGRAHRIYTHRGGVMTYKGRRALRYKVVRLLLRSGFGHVTGSEQAARAVERLFGIPASTVVQSINGVDLAVFPAAVERDVLRTSMGIHDESVVVIGTAARLRPLKRVDWLLHAVCGLGEEQWRVLVLGDGPDRRRLEFLAQELLPPDRVVFKGMVSDMGSWLRAMDVFVLPSGPEEGFGNAVVEAMAFGVPVVVCADSPALASHVKSGRNGLVVRDVTEMTHALDSLVRKPSLRHNLGAAAQRDAAARYSMARCADVFETLYRHPRAAASASDPGSYQAD